MEKLAVSDKFIMSKYLKGLRKTIGNAKSYEDMDNLTPLLEARSRKLDQLRPGFSDNIEVFLNKKAPLTGDMPEDFKVFQGEVVGALDSVIKDLVPKSRKVTKTVATSASSSSAGSSTLSTTDKVGLGTTAALGLGGAGYAAYKSMENKSK